MLQLNPASLENFVPKLLQSAAICAEELGKPLLALGMRDRRCFGSPKKAGGELLNR
jgi:hypothetical protein